MLTKQLIPIVFFKIIAIALPSITLAAPVIDQPAPLFVGTDANGKQVDLEKLRGNTVVLEWTNHDCPFVIKHYNSGNIPQLQRNAVTKGIVWLQVISSAPGKQGYVDGATANKLNKARGAAPSGTVLDPEGKIGRLYDAKTTPHMFIINKEGILVYKGGIDSIPSSKTDDIAIAENYVKTALAAIESGKKIGNPSTRPYGCTIKYADQ